MKEFWANDALFGQAFVKRAISRDIYMSILLSRQNRDPENDDDNASREARGEQHAFHLSRYANCLMRIFWLAVLMYPGGMV